MRGFEGDRGATAITTAISMIVIMGMVAIAIDLGLGFNERRQDQTAADLSVMAAATENVLGGSQQDIVSSALDFARKNLDTTYTDGEWEALWEACTDPEGQGFDIGGTTGTVNFQPMENLDAWAVDGPAELPCISTVGSFLRVRIPDQEVSVSFGRILGFDSLRTHADAVALIESTGALGGVIPFGIPGGTDNGEICLKTSGSGTAIDPCQGPDAGGFGEIDSEFFGTFFGAPDCGTPGAPELARNIALGIDHAIATWDGDYPVFPIGSPHPGDGDPFDPQPPTIAWYDDVGYDACNLVGGAIEPEFPGHAAPPNTMRVGVGFSPAAVEEGLVSNSMFLGTPSRLQQGSGPTRDLVKKQTGVTTVYRVDNVGLWDYLKDNNDVYLSDGITPVDECDGTFADYGIEVFDPDPVAELAILEAKTAAMDKCLRAYDSSEGIIFKDMEDSPRLVWAPEYWHAPSTTGKSWQPVLAFRLVFIGGTFWNCNAGGCGVIHYPDLASSKQLCDLNPSSGRCQEANLDQLSAWLLPFDALPEGSIPPLPGTDQPFETSLLK